MLLSAELKMDVLREREVKDSLERQLTEEQKQRGEPTVPNALQSRVEHTRLANFPLKATNTRKKKLIAAADEL